MTKDYDKDTLENELMGIKGYSIGDQSQIKKEVLPPPGFPLQNTDREVFKYKKIQQTGDGRKEEWIRKWKKTIR